MFSLDLALIFLIMGVVFIRQIKVFRNSQKINYSPLILAIGVLGGVLHLLLVHSLSENFFLYFQESLLSIFVSIVLFIIMNIIHQTTHKEIDKLQEEALYVLSTQITQMNDYIGSLESMLNDAKKSRDDARTLFLDGFSSEIKSLELVKENQQKFISQFEELMKNSKNSLIGFEEFTKEQLPNFEEVLHRHIEILRISEQDHFNKIEKKIVHLGEVIDNNDEKIDTAQELLLKLNQSYSNTSDKIVSSTKDSLENVFKSSINSLNIMKSQGEEIELSMSEENNRLDQIKQSSELLIKQIVLSGKKLETLYENANDISAKFNDMSSLTKDLEIIKEDYQKSIMTTAMINDSLQRIDEMQIEKIRDHIESLSERMTLKIDESLNKLHNHYHIAHDDITQSVQELTRKAEQIRKYEDS